MGPIDKFIHLDSIYNIADKDEEYTKYIWSLVMILKPYQEEDEPFESSLAVPIFKQRYNDRLIKMPWSYEEYLKNKDIQVTISGLGFDKDKFWFVLLFIYIGCSISYKTLDAIMIEPHALDPKRIYIISIKNAS